MIAVLKGLKRNFAQRLVIGSIILTEVMHDEDRETKCDGKSLPANVITN